MILVKPQNACKNHSRRSLLLHWGKKQKARFTKPQLPSSNRGNHRRAAGGAATKRGLGMREEKQGEAEIHKRNELRGMICYRVPVVHSHLATTGSMIATLKQPSFVSDDEIQAYSSTLQVTMQLLSGERKREREPKKPWQKFWHLKDKLSLTITYSSSAAKINQ